MRLLDARIDLYSGCNYRCTFCGDESSCSNPVFPLENMDIIFPILNKSCWSVYLSCGGEPTLHPRFEAVMQKVKTLLPLPDVTLVTNGYNLTKSHADAIVNSGITRIFVSIHATDPVLYSRLCGCKESSLKRVMDNVAYLIKAKKGGYPKVIITSIAMRSTVPIFDSIADWIIRNNADAMNVQWLLTEYNPELKKTEYITHDEVRNEIRSVQKKLLLNGKQFYYPFSLGTEKMISMLRNSKLIKNKAQYVFFLMKKYMASVKKNNCRVAGNTCIILPTGEIQICHKNLVKLPNLITNPDLNLSKVLKLASRNLKRNTSGPCATDCPYYG